MGVSNEDGASSWIVVRCGQIICVNDLKLNKMLIHTTFQVENIQINGTFSDLRLKIDLNIGKHHKPIHYLEIDCSPSF